MSDVKWIKITTDIFDDEKIYLIEQMPDADSLIVIWFKLLCLAGKQNNSGVFLLNNRIPYTEKMLATIFRRKESTVQLALQTFEQLGMVEFVDGVITIPNWSKHQSLDKLEKQKAYMREYMKNRREEQRLIAESKTNCKTNSKTNVSSPDKIREEEEPDKNREETPYQAVVALYHEICVSFPRIKSLSDARRKAIKARLNTYTLEQFREMFGKAEASDFLKGNNIRNWSATFDWMMNGNNFAKIIDGNYDNKGGTTAGTKAAQDLDNWYNTVREWADN